MNWRRAVKIEALIVALLLCAMAVSTYSQQPGGYVPLPLIQKAANYYGGERWPGCQMVAITPYLALDGSVNAYAVQFAKKGCALATEADIAKAVAARQKVEKLIKSNCPVEAKEATDQPGNLPDQAPQRNDADKMPANVSVTPGYAVLPPDALQKADTASKEELEQEKKYVAWQNQVKVAANASVLWDQIGTVIIAARYDLYPLLESFDGVAPQIKFLSKVNALAASPQSQIKKTYYLGPMAIFHEVGNGAAVQVVDPLDDQVLDFNKANVGGNNGRLPAAPVGKCPISPKDFWSSIDKNGAPPKTGGDDHAGAGSGSISGVPYYHQDNFGAASCGPTASAQALGYWDDHWYGNLIDNGSSSYSANSIHVRELVYNLMRAEGYSPTVGIYGNRIEPGIEAVCNSSTYGNNLNFNVTSISEPSWTTIKNEIIAGRPFVYFNWKLDVYPRWAHFTTGTGYNDTSGHKLYVHYNYAPDTPYLLNWDNIPASNEALYRVHPNNTPNFYCPWSEDFEGAFPGPWRRGSNGGTYGYWKDVSYRAHNYTPNPSPPGGATAWSGYYYMGANPPGPYRNNANGWMIYGPFNTLNRTSGEFSAYIWRITESAHDYVALYASVDGTHFYGRNYWGNYPSWYRCVLNLANVYVLGNLMNRPRVWVAVWFHSDSSAVYQGAYVDDITIKYRY